MTDPIARLVDGQEVMPRWKMATVIAFVALILALVTQIAKAGAKSERIDTMCVDVKELKGLYPRMDNLEAKSIYQDQWLEKMDKKLDRLLERHGH